MKEKPILIHTHFHYQRTGVTRSIENVFPYFEENFEPYVYGKNVNANRIGFTQLINFFFSNRKIVIHCHRNNEILRCLLFRVFGAKFTLISTRHAETKPSGFTVFLHKKTDAVITLTERMTSYFSFPTLVVGHGVDINIFKPKKGVELGQIKQRHIISCAGRVRSAKGQGVLIDAIGPILKEYPNWALVVVGKVDDLKFRSQLENTISKNKINNQVYFIEETPQIVTFYQASHTVVVPSFSEGFSLVCAEAMSCACNVIATENVGIHSALIQPNENGYLFEAGNNLQLQDLLCKTMQSAQPHLGEKARNSIASFWSAEKEAKELGEIYMNAK